MKRRSQAQWRALFQAQQISGRSAAAFCREQRICPKYFSLRRRQLLDAASFDAADAVSRSKRGIWPLDSGRALEARDGDA